MSQNCQILNPRKTSTSLSKKPLSNHRKQPKQSKGKKPGVFIEATAKELHTCSPDSWAAKLVELAGGKNAAPDAAPLRAGSAIAPWGLERIMKSASQGAIDVYIVQQGAMNASTPADVKARPWFSALKKTKLAAVPEGELSRPSLLGLEAGGKRLVKIFYGE